MSKNFRCELCFNKSSKKIIDTVRDGYFGNYISYDVEICKNCSLIQLSNYINSKKIINYYKHNYLKKTYNYLITPPEHSDSSMGIDSQKIRGKKIYQFLIKERKIFLKNFSDLDILDIGCGPGGLQVPFLNKVNSIMGIDPILESIKLGKQMGHDIEYGFIEKINRPSKSCDLILLLGTIEHAYDLNKAIRECKRVLRDNGKIFMRIRSTRLWGSTIEYFNTNHYRYFNSDSIRFLADKYNLKIILKTDTEIENKPGAEYYILEKNKKNKSSTKNKKNNYKKILSYFNDYEYEYFKSSSEFISECRKYDYDLNKVKKIINLKKSKIRTLSKNEIHIKRAVVESKKFIDYFINAKRDLT